MSLDISKCLLGGKTIPTKNHWVRLSFQTLESRSFVIPAIYRDSWRLISKRITMPQRKPCTTKALLWNFSMLRFCGSAKSIPTFPPSPLFHLWPLQVTAFGLTGVCSGSPLNRVFSYLFLPHFIGQDFLFASNMNWFWKKKKK